MLSVLDFEYSALERAGADGAVRYRLRGLVYVQQ